MSNPGTVVRSGTGLARRGQVVVGYDATPESMLAVEWGVRWAQAFGSRMTILYAVDPGVSLPFRRESRSDEAVAHAAESVARRGADLARSLDRDLEVHSIGLVGHPSAELVALSQDADVVVVGRRGPGGPRGKLGSVSYALGAHARCPVIVVQGPDTIRIDPGHPVVVGVDSSRSSNHALGFAAEVATAAEAELIVTSAWAPSEYEPWMFDVLGTAGPRGALVEADRARAVKSVQEALETVARTHPGLPTSSLTPEGTPEETLLDVSRGAGLLVVGTRGRGGFVGLMLGSVSRAVLREAQVPVAVVGNPIS